MKKQKIKNYGFSADLEALHRSPEDEVFGAVEAPCIAVIPEAERLTYLPRGERQNIGDEKMDCASRGPVNKLETKFTYLVQKKKLHPENEKWLRDNGYVTADNRVEFSDAFIAIKSGTTRQGNSLKAPLQAIHESGLVPKNRLPQVDSFDAYYDPKRITPELEALGKELIRRFPIRYQIVQEHDYDRLYQEDMLIEAGFAWPVPYNGEYPRVDMQINHVFVGVMRPLHTVFDNYEESPGDFIKKLAADYNLLGYGYRVYIAETKPPLSHDQKKSLWELIKNFFGKEREVQKLEPILNPDFVEETPTERLKKECIKSVGLDLSDEAPNELGCANTVSNILDKVYGGFPKILSTVALDVHLATDIRFKSSDVQPWVIIVSPTKGLEIGHVGVLGENGVIYSNHSATGKLDTHWDLDRWIANYRTKKKLRVRFYKLV